MEISIVIWIVSGVAGLCGAILGAKTWWQKNPDWSRVGIALAGSFLIAALGLAFAALALTSLGFTALDPRLIVVPLVVAPLIGGAVPVVIMLFFKMFKPPLSGTDQIDHISRTNTSR